VSAVGVNPDRGRHHHRQRQPGVPVAARELVWPSGSLANTTPITVPPPIARTDPGTGEVLSPLRRPYRHRQINDAAGLSELQRSVPGDDTLDPRVAHDAIGAKLLVATATPDIDSWRNADGTLKPNPFGPGTKWAFSTARVYNSTDPAIWVKASALSVEWRTMAMPRVLRGRACAGRVLLPPGGHWSCWTRSERPALLLRGDISEGRRI
jgi:hypothetical protein